MTKVIGYIRVSSVSQVEGTSLSVQKKAIEDFCRNKGWEIDKIYADEGVSAYKLRPQYEKMMERVLNDSEVYGVVVHSLTRFGRSTDDLFYRVRLLREKNKILASINEGFDLSKKEGELLFGLLAVIVNYERKLLLERMEEGRNYAKQQGIKFGRPEKDIDWDTVKKYKVDWGLSWDKTVEILNKGKDKDDCVTRITIQRQAKRKGIEL
jgi:DNA invertase Pin-like site-specific DNA recombinase